jgi:outer membrane murein-binding lipoprotein Lpp
MGIETLGTSLFLIDYSDKNKLFAYRKADLNEASGRLEPTDNTDPAAVDLNINPRIAAIFKKYSKTYILCELDLYNSNYELHKGTEKLPVAIQKSRFSIPEEVIDKLRSTGLYIVQPKYNVLILTNPSKNGSVQGLYVDIKNDTYLINSHQNYRLRSSNYTLKKYSFDSIDQLYKYSYKVAEPENDQNSFYLTSQESLEKYSTDESSIMSTDLNNAVRTEILKRLKNHTSKIGFYSQNLKLLRSYLDDLDENVWTDDLAKKFHCDVDKINEAYEGIFQNAEYLAAGDDEDMANLKYAIKNNETIRQIATDTVKNDWEKENNSKIQQTQQLTEKINLLSTKQATLTKQVDQLTIKKDELEKKQQLATDVETKVQQRIDEARKNAADFIAEMAFNQAATPKIYSVSHPQHLAISPFNPIKFKVDQQAAPIESASAKLAYNALKGPLLSMIDNQALLNELTAYLYVLHNQNRPLLLIGDDALDIAQLAALLLTGQPATQIECTGNFSAAVCQELQNIESPVIVLNNLIGSAWLSHINSLVHLSNKWLILTESFTDDLNLAPLGLYNFAAPIFTDVFELQSSKLSVTPAIDQSAHFYQFNYPPLADLKGINKSMRNHIEEETAWITKVLNGRDAYLPLFGYIYASGKKHLLSKLLNKIDTPTAHHLIKFQELD